MKKIILLLLTITTVLLSSCNDSSRGVLQWAYQLAAEDESTNQSYLGHDDTNIYLQRDGDVYRAYSTPTTTNSTRYEIRYEKILELTNKVPYPIFVEDDVIYMVNIDIKGKSCSFFYIDIPAEGEISNEKYQDALKNNTINTVYFPSNPNSDKPITIYDVKWFGLSSVISHDESGNIYPQVIFGTNNDNVAYYSRLLSVSKTRLEFSAPVDFPTKNIQIIGDGVLKATSDDPLIDIDDNMNKLYLIEDDNYLTIRTFHDSLDYPMGSDGDYAAMASGEICAIEKYENKIDEYDGRLHQSTLRFDVTDREGNYLITYKDGKSIVGYLSDNGLYWREDIDDSNENTHKSQPDIISVSEDSDIMPLSFVGKHKTEANEYLLITQDNGFYILRPHASGVQRLEKVRSGSSYQLSDFFN